MKKLCNVKWVMFNVIMFCTLHFAYYTAFAEAVSSVELIANAKQYDNKVVEYEGELIGDVLNRKDFAWLNIHDGQNAIGVWAAKADTEVIKHTGNYKQKGDWVAVSGIFHKACLEHGGGLDIHAQEISVVKEGTVLNEVFSGKKNVVLFYVLGVLACLMIIYILQKRQSLK